LNSGEHFVVSGPWTVTQFLHDDQTFSIPHIHGKCCSAAGLQRGVPLFGDPFNILGKVIGASLDDYVFHSTA